MSGGNGERPCSSIIFLIHPCCYEVLSDEQVRADDTGAAIESLAVSWSDGSEEAFPVPARNRAVVVVRGQGTVHD